MLIVSGKTMGGSECLQTSYEKSTSWAGWKIICHLNVAHKIKIFLWTYARTDYVFNIIHCQLDRHLHLDSVKHIIFQYSLSNIFSFNLKSVFCSSFAGLGFMGIDFWKIMKWISLQKHLIMVSLI